MAVVPRAQRYRGRMEFTIRYFDGCPNWQTARERLDEALRDLGAPRDIGLELVTTEDEATRLSFRGSPTILVDGRDLFDPGDAPVGLSCRVYVTPEGFAGTPTVAQLREALAAVSGRGAVQGR